MDSGFMGDVAEQLGERGICVVRFEFPYMQERRNIGKKRPPNRQPELLTCFTEAIQLAVKTYGDGQGCYLMGKSMGGRMASILSTECGGLVEGITINKVFALGYPFHPINKPEKLRTEHFSALPCPLHVFQGTRDKLGGKTCVAMLDLAKQVNMHWLEDGDHDLKPRVKSGYTQQQHLDTVIDTIANIIIKREK